MSGSFPKQFHQMMGNTSILLPDFAKSNLGLFKDLQITAWNESQSQPHNYKRLNHHTVGLTLNYDGESLAGNLRQWRTTIPGSLTLHSLGLDMNVKERHAVGFCQNCHMVT